MTMKIAKPGLVVALALTFLVGMTASLEQQLPVAGDVDDNLNWNHYATYQNRTAEADDLLPRPDLADRLVVQVKDSSGNPFSCANVRVGDKELPTGSDGRLYVFPRLDGVVANDTSLWNLRARAPDGFCPDDCTEDYTLRVFYDEESKHLNNLEMLIPTVASLPQQLDLALVFSSCNLLPFLKTDLDSMVEYALGVMEHDVDVRVAVVLSRGEEVVQTHDFATLEQAIGVLEAANCGNAGGDDEAEEAMEQALSQTNQLQWRTGNVARVALLMADVPSRNSDLQATLDAALGLRRKGVRLYGLASRGAATTTEYLLRMMALLTGARYAWVEDDWASITIQQLQPSVLCSQLSRLDSLLKKLLMGELLGKRIELIDTSLLEEVGQQDKGICLVDVTPQAPANASEDLPFEQGPVESGGVSSATLGAVAAVMAASVLLLRGW